MESKAVVVMLESSEIEKLKMEWEMRSVGEVIGKLVKEILNE